MMSKDSIHLPEKIRQKNLLLIVLEYVRGDAKQPLSMERIHDPAQQSMG